MANQKKLKLTGFKFKPFSKKQMKVLTYWQDNSPVSDKFLLVADGSVRSGKTICCSLSFILFVMDTFNGMNAAMVGRSSGALRRNVVNTLKQMLLGMGYDCVDHRADNYLEITKNNVTNLFWLFGAKDESSADLIQGITLCALYIDEVALIPQSFFNQATARLSVDGSKCMVCCNPASPHHWFYQDVLKHLKEKNGMYVHFTMDDNLTLSEEVKNRYKTMYSGVFKKRFIDGKWVVADGLIYDMFSDRENIVNSNEIPYDKIIKWCIGVDYGTGNATVFLLSGKDVDGNIYIVKEYYFAGREEARKENDYDAQKTDLEFAEDMRAFIEENKYLTGKGYRDIEIMIDPAAASFKLQLRRFHMKAKNANNSVIDGIRTMATFIGARTLFVSNECRFFIKEVHTYSWDSKAQLRGEDRPLKTEDHVMDAARYLCMRLKDKHKIENVSRNVGW